jgi:hypothetical protein
MCLSAGLAVFTSRLSTACCRMLGSQVTNKQTVLDSLFLDPLDCTLIQILPSVAVMVLHRNVLQEDDILCELYVDTHSDVSDYSDNESLDSDSDIPTTSSHKQLVH